MTERLAEAFAAQAYSNESLGSPFTARVLRSLAAMIAPGTPVMDRMLGFDGDVGPYGASIPLRLLGGLHALVLTGEAPELAAVYPPNPAPLDAALADVLRDALVTHEARLLEWLALPPQTNEVRRAAALIAGASVIAARFGKPFVLSELGASGGLNLMWDRFELALPGRTIGPNTPALTLDPDWTGPLPPTADLHVSDRRGVDLNPMNPRDPEDALRLRSYLWADQPHRMTLTDKAIAVAEARVDRGDAATWLTARLATTHPGHVHLVTHTIAWQYFPPATQATCLAALNAAGNRATEDAPLARLAMEADTSGDAGAALTLTMWPGGETVQLARVDFHGRWIEWQGYPGFT